MCPPNVLCMILIHKVYQQSSNCMFCCIGRMGNGSTNQSAHDFDAPCKDKRTLTHTHTHTQGGTATLQLGWHSRHNGARLISRAPLLPRLRTNYGFVFDFRNLRFAFCLWRSSRQWVHQHFFAWLWCTMCHKMIGFFVFRCAGRMGHVSSKRSLRDFDTQCITTVFELHVLLYGSNGSCVHLTFVFFLHDLIHIV